MIHWLFRHRISGMVFSMLLLSQIGTSQCSATYNTYNNFCDLSTLYLEAVPIGGTGPYTFLWETGETTQTIIIPLATGNYSVTVTDANGCTVTINCHIKPNPLVIYYPYNQNACGGDTINLFLEWFRDSIPGATYLWSTGDTTPSIQLTDDLVWSVTITDPATGCAYVIPEGLFDFHWTPTPQIVGPENMCDGQSVTLSVAGGPFSSIVWYPGGVYSETFTVTEPGEYIVWASAIDANWCWKQDTIVITAGDIDPPMLTGPPSLCQGQEGIIEVTNSNSYTEFAWNNGQTTSAITVNQPGTYSVTVTDAGGCTSTGSIEIGDGSDFMLSEQVEGSTCGESNGSIDLSVSPPGSYVYAWSDGSTGEDLSDLPAGSYSVTVTSSGGCSLTNTFIVPDNPIPITITEMISANTSCNTPNGSIDITIQPPGVYQYQWSNGATSEDLTGIAPGEYTISVTLGVSCTATATYLVGNAIDAPQVTAAEIHETCGEANGSIDLIVSGGMAPYAYIWSNGLTSEDISGLSAGVYHVSVTGANGCTEVFTVEILNESIEIALTAETIPVTSCIESNGSIDLTISPPGSYQVTWSNGAVTEDISNLSEGIYTVEVLLGQTCVETASFVIQHSGIQPDIQALVQPNSACTDYNGSIDIAVSPDDDYTFAWSNGETSEDLINIGPGTYTVTITDPQDCSYFESYIIIDSSGAPVLTAQSLPATCGQPNGSIDLSVIPPDGATFSWSNGADTEDLNNLLPGFYAVTVTDASGCTASDTVEVSGVPSAITLSGSVHPNTACTFGNGDIELVVSPAGSYTYVWSNGVTTQNPGQLSAGIYTVTITDSTGCTNTASYVIADSLPTITIASQITHAQCGQETGTILLTVMPDNDYDFAWSSGDTTAMLTGLASGSFTVSVTDPNGCRVTDTFQIENNNSNISINATISADTACDASNGAIDLAISPAGSYTFLWSNGMTSPSIYQVEAGIYTVTITDSVMCAVERAFTIPDLSQAPVISATVAPETCAGSDGAILITVSPQDNYTFTWSNGWTSPEMHDVPSGTYSVTVTGTDGCSAEASFVVESAGTDFDVFAGIAPNTSCGQPNGAIDLTMDPPGSYTFTWSNGITSEDITGIAAGAYSVTITDSAGCQNAKDFLLPDETVAPQIMATVTPAGCNTNDGSIDLIVHASNVAIIWSNGSAQEDQYGLSPGIYAVTVTDSLGCTTADTFEIGQATTEFVLSWTTTPGNSCTEAYGTIDLSITPAGAYTFLWSNGAMTEDLQNLSPGTYTVTVSAGLACDAEETIVVEDDSVFPDVISNVSPATCGEENGMITLAVTPNAESTFQWSNGATGSAATGLAPGIYHVTVTTSTGCDWTQTFTVGVSTLPEIALEADLSVSYGDEVIIRCEVNVPMDAIDTILWITSATLSCTSGLCLEQKIRLTEPTEVTVMVFDTNGCLTERSLMLELETDPRVFIPNIFSPNDDGSNDYFTVIANSDVEEVLDLRIYDRWGEFIFQNTHFQPNIPEYGWDGTFRGKSMNPAVFVYWTVVKFKDGTEQLLKGDITLVR